MVSDLCILSSIFKKSSSLPKHVIIGDGSRVPVISHSTSLLSNSSFLLSNNLVAPSLVKNLIFVRHFTRDNNCSIKFDPFDFYVKDLRTQTVIQRCNSSGYLYSFTSLTMYLPPRSLSLSLSRPSSRTLWHQHLGHPGNPALSILVFRSLIFVSQSATSLICNAC